GHYFAELAKTGGDVHRTFRTGPVEPKQAAIAAIVAAAAGEPATIVAEDWWTFFPLYYLAGSHGELHVEFCTLAADEPTAKRRFLGGFAGGPCELWLARHAPDLPKQSAVDYAGRPVLHVWDLGTRSDWLSELAAAVKAAPRDDAPE